MVLSFIKRALGQEEVQLSDNPFGDKDAPQAAMASPLVTEVPAAPELRLQRDEIIDSKGRIAGYRFNPALAGGGRISFGKYAALLADEAVTALARRRLALLPLTLSDWEQGSFSGFAESGTTFLLQAPLHATPDAQWAAAVEEIKASGAGFALSDRSLPPPAKALLPQSRLFLLDFTAMDLPRFEKNVKTLRQHLPDLKLAADNVSSWPERRLCLSLGIEYCLGGFASTPDEDAQQKNISESRLVLIEMLNLLRRDAELLDLVDVAKRDPGVSLHIVTMANSPMVGLAQPVASLDQAIVVLGRASLYRWLTVSLFRAGSSLPRDETLLELALARARFLELTALGHLSKAESEELFLVGLLSVMDALLGMPMEKVLEKMHLPQDVRDVLLRSEGPHGRYLMLAMALERGRSDQVEKLAQALGLDAACLSANLLAALAWAEESMVHNKG